MSSSPPPPTPPQQDPHVHLFSYAILNPTLPLGITISPPHQPHPLHFSKVRRHRAQRKDRKHRAQRTHRLSAPPVSLLRALPIFSQHLQQSEFWICLFQKRDVFLYCTTLIFKFLVVFRPESRKYPVPLHTHHHHTKTPHTNLFFQIWNFVWIFFLGNAITARGTRSDALPYSFVYRLGLCHAGWSTITAEEPTHHHTPNAALCSSIYRINCWWVFELKIQTH